MSSIENILGGIKNRPTPQQTISVQSSIKKTIIPESGKAGILEIPNTGKRESGNTGKIQKPIPTLTTGDYKKFTMMVRRDLLQKIKTLNMDISYKQDKFIPEYLTLEEIITYYFENNK